MGFFIFTLVAGGMLWATVALGSYSKGVKQAQEQYRADKARYAVSSNYTPIHMNTLSAESAELELLKYRLQNTEYRERLFLLGIWYFGLSGIWAMNKDNVDPHALAEEVAKDMPWVLDRMKYDDINNTALSEIEFNPEITPVAPECGLPVAFTDAMMIADSGGMPQAPPTDILNMVTSPENMYTIPVPWSESYRQDPDFWVNLYGRDTPVQLPDGTVVNGDEVFDTEMDDYDYEMSRPTEPNDIHVEQDMDFFPEFEPPAPF